LSVAITVFLPLPVQCLLDVICNNVICVIVNYSASYF